MTINTDAVLESSGICLRECTHSCRVNEGGKGIVSEGAVILQDVPSIDYWNLTLFYADNYRAYTKQQDKIKINHE